MSDYILAYHGGREPASPEEGAAGKQRFMAWIGGLGDAVVNPGTPLGAPKTVSSHGVTDTGRGATRSPHFTNCRNETWYSLPISDTVF